MTTLYVVATPIGNLKDITLRALEVFKNTNVIVCEDTRVTRSLFSAHGIDASLKTLISYHTHNKIVRTDRIIDHLREWNDVVFVSDAGTPGISDPGAELVSVIRRELADEISRGEIKIEAVPGPSALVAALSVSGVPCANFTFLGFLPHKKGRETLFKEISASTRTCVFYESPHRILKTLESLDKHLKAKRVTICRELTKVFEEVVGGTAGDVLKFFNTHPDKVRGEFVVIVSE